MKETWEILKIGSKNSYIEPFLHKSGETAFEVNCIQCTIFMYDNNNLSLM